jgi:hypothetical protein
LLKFKLKKNKGMEESKYLKLEENYTKLLKDFEELQQRFLTIRIENEALKKKNKDLEYLKSKEGIIEDAETVRAKMLSEVKKQK